MAKGNIGNLLQHFVALRCGEALLGHWNQPHIPVAYIDCYSMAPWEEVTGKSSQGFDAIIRRFPVKAQSGDRVAATFLFAWHRRYSPTQLPPHPRDRDYPNTAVLLRTAFPDQTWEMRLHDIDKQSVLEEWIAEQPPGFGAVHGDWSQSPLIRNAPVSATQAVFVMLDPNQIVADDNAKADSGFYLPDRMLRFLIGQHGVDLLDRPSQPGAAPAVVTLFSYSDGDPTTADRIVTDRFAPAGWSVERVRSGPWKTFGKDSFHIGWVVSCHLKTPLVPPSLQSAWDGWVA